MFKTIYLFIFCVICFRKSSESITPLIIFGNEDNGIYYDYIEGDFTNRTIVVENSTRLYPTTFRIKSFDYDLDSRHFIFASNEYPYQIYMYEFKSKHINQNNIKLQITKRSIIGPKNSQTRLAIDWIHKLIYFFKYQSLSVIHMDKPEISYDLTRSENPPGSWKYSAGNIAVNPFEAFIVWTEYNSIDGIAIIRKCNGDGSEQSILVHKDIRLPICITIDYKTKTIVWIDNELHSLSSIDYFGNNRKTIKQSKQLFSDCSSMDSFDDYVYWTSIKNNKVFRVNISGDDIQNESVEDVITSDTDIDFVKIMSPSKQLMDENFCSSANCSHICLPENNQSYRCLCSDIPQLEACNETQIVYPSPKIPDQKQDTTAVSQLFKSEEPLLLFTASKRDIRLTKLVDNQTIHYSESEYLYKLDSYVTVIDYSIFGNFMVWLKTEPSIYTYLSKTVLFGSPIDETTTNSLSVDTIKPMVNLSENSLLKTLTIDWIHNLVYFPICETTKGIFVANLSSPQNQYLIVPQNSCITKDIKVDPIESLIFWSEYHEATYNSYSSHTYRYSYSQRYRNSQSSKYHIMKSSQDGQNIEKLAERQYVRKNSLTLDFEGKKIYWIDINSLINRLYAMDYEGNNLITVNPSVTLFEDFSSMDLFKDHIYWTNTEDDTIRRITKKQSSETDAHIVLQSGIDIDAIRIVDKSRQPNGTNKCLNHDCLHICLPSSGQHNFSCVCPMGEVWNHTSQVCVHSGLSTAISAETTTVTSTRRTTSSPFVLLDNDPKLLYVIYKEGIYVKQSIYDLNTNYIESFQLKSDEDWITEIDFNYNENYVLWLESSVFEGFSLYAAPIDKGRPNGLNITIFQKIITKTYNSKRLSFDWIHKLVYLSVPKGIEVFSIESRHYYCDIITHDDVQGDLAVDPVEGYIFWSQWRYTMASLHSQHIGRIYRANQDGSDMVGLTSSAKIPNTLAIDLQSKIVYWIDTSFYALYSVDYSGANQNTILSVRPIFDGAFSMDIYNDYIFWSNYDKNAILMTEKTGANNTEQLVLVNAYTDVEGIKILDSSRQPNATNRCANNNCTQNQLCIPVQQSYRCICSKSKSSVCKESTTPGREMSSPGTNPINSEFISNDPVDKLSQKLDKFHALINETVLNGNKNESNHHWIAIVVISLLVNLILIAFFIYRKKKMNPFSKYIKAKFHNDREEIFLDERVDDDI